ncbi:hypothetical protein POV27_18670 [Aureisphaera galaxeae]|uniref:hypothetical protein n=1 Tax=Aureisphaera galaxeae TaxID=1538023 RepID=UPI00235097B1|nr:hypothetical protein [Aureisphaera galaxeae]MDC8006083.1 hypothetical protein [Aureisphaera galaxeae]
MSKIKLLYLIIPFLLIGCKSDDDGDSNTQGTSELIIGSWELVEYSRDYSINGTEVTGTEQNITSDYVIRFRNSPQDIAVSGTLTYAVEETITQNGSSNTTNFTASIFGDAGEGYHVGNWRIENGNLVTRAYETDPDEEGAFDLITEITELTSDNLTLTIDNAQYSAPGSTQAGTTTLRYVKQ